MPPGGVGEEVACIDHHPSFVPMEYRYRDIRPTGACATIIARYYQEFASAFWTPWPARGWKVIHK